METVASKKRVVITGMGIVASLGHNVNDFWASIVAGKCGVDLVTLFDAKDYSCRIGAEVRGWDATQHMDPKEVRRNDRYTHFGFCAAKQAVADASLDMTKERRSRGRHYRFRHRRHAHD